MPHLFRQTPKTIRALFAEIIKYVTDIADEISKESDGVSKSTKEKKHDAAVHIGNCLKPFTRANSTKILISITQELFRRYNMAPYTGGYSSRFEKIILRGLLHLSIYPGKDSQKAVVPFRRVVAMAQEEIHYEAVLEVLGSVLPDFIMDALEKIEVHLRKIRSRTLALFKDMLIKLSLLVRSVDGPKGAAKIFTHQLNAESKSLITIIRLHQDEVPQYADTETYSILFDAMHENRKDPSLRAILKAHVEQVSGESDPDVVAGSVWSLTPSV